MNGIILAGGEGTRLGPLGAQMNKCLVSFGGRPMIVHHVNAMRRAGCERIVIITSEQWERQVFNVVESAYGNGLTDLIVTVQDRPRGPADAVEQATLALPVDADDESVLVLMADTYVHPDTLQTPGQWVAVAAAPNTRRWCGLIDHQWYDTVFEKGDEVAIGAYRFTKLSELRYSARCAIGSAGSNVNEVGMAPLLNFITARTLLTHTWLDTGDITALAQARSKKMMSRSFNSVTLRPNGYVRKMGRIEDEARYFLELDDDQRSVFPRFNYLDREAYETELITSPSVAELFLYWPFAEGAWEHVMRTIIIALTTIWEGEPPAGETYGRTRDLMTMKAVTRIVDWESDITTFNRLVVNGKELRAGMPAVRAAATRLWNAWPKTDHVFPHGDPNFTNVFYDLGYDSVRFIDPRGDTLLEVAYDIAKLDYSARGFAAITHGLYEYSRDEARVQFTLTCKTERKEEEIRRVLDDFGLSRNDLTLMSGLLFIAGAPLHDGEEGEALYVRGIQLLNEVPL